MRSVPAIAAAMLSLLAFSSVASAAEPKQGGILRMYHRDSPGSASIHEEATYSVNIPFMPVFNNLVIYKQDVAQNSLDSIVPDLPESWRWGGGNNPRSSWYDQVADVTTNGDFEAAFTLKRPQPALLALLASGYTPIYPCHVSPAEMRTYPIGTGPFKFVEFKANESIKLARNPDYWKKGLPHLDGIEFTIIPNRSTATLAI